MTKQRAPLDKRNTARWQRLRAQVIKEEPTCYLQLPGCTRRSTTADHVIPIDVRPDLCLVRGNLRGACAPCNIRKRHQPLTQVLAKYSTPATAPGLSWFD